MTHTVLLCGVGGQGTILAAHVLADVASMSGYDVKVSEIHGMSQRGGAVTTVVRFGDKVYSMVCDKGQADTIVSFEMIEALRNIEMLKIGGLLISNDEVIKPASVLTGNQNLPNNIRQTLIDLGGILVPAEANAREAGNSKASNVVLLGALSNGFDFPIDTWKSAIESRVPPKTIKTNLLAFDAGRAFVEERLN